MGSAFYSIGARCSCRRELPRVEVGEHATVIATRTCRGCGRRWRLVLKPGRAITLPNGAAAFVHVVDLVEVPRA